MLPVRREDVLDDLRSLRDRPPPTDPASVGCTTAIVAILALVFMPFIGRGFDLTGGVMAGLGLGLFFVALVGGGVGIFGGGFARGAAIGRVESAIDEVVAAYAAGHEERCRQSTVRVLDGVHVTVGATTSPCVDASEAAERLGPAAGYVEAVERILLEEGQIEPFLTARSSP